MSDFCVDTGSFRDPSGSVYYREDRVYRTVNSRMKKNYEQMRDQGIYVRAIEKGFLIDSNELPIFDASSFPYAPSYVLEHKKIPYISYPYEWSFTFLKAAALHHLDFQLFLLENDAILCDASAFNIQFFGCRPIFIDILSIEPYQPKQYWGAYKQFCEHFLNPLLLQSIKGINFNEIYRGTLNGIQGDMLNRMLSFTDKLSLRVLMNVVLPTIFEKNAKKNPEQSVKKIKASHGLSKLAYRTFILNLRNWINELLPLEREKSIWALYEKNNTYAFSETDAKIQLVKEFAASGRFKKIIDLGCNSGIFSLAALDGGADYVVGYDSDHDAINQASRGGGVFEAKFLPLIQDIANPSPNLGWSQCERKGFVERNTADGVIALAFVHHLVIAKNIPLERVLEWIMKLAPRGLIEFVPKSDPTVKMMLSLREDIFFDYDVDVFERILRTHGAICKRVEITNSNRIIYEYSC